jgi:hypothetical protein
MKKEMRANSLIKSLAVETFDFGKNSGVPLVSTPHTISNFTIDATGKSNGLPVQRTQLYRHQSSHRRHSLSSWVFPRRLLGQRKQTDIVFAIEDEQTFPVCDILA